MSRVRKELNRKDFSSFSQTIKSIQTILLTFYFDSIEKIRIFFFDKFSKINKRTDCYHWIYPLTFPMGQKQCHSVKQSFRHVSSTVENLFNLSFCPHSPNSSLLSDVSFNITETQLNKIIEEESIEETNGNLNRSVIEGGIIHFKMLSLLISFLLSVIDMMMFIIGLSFLTSSLDDLMTVSSLKIDDIFIKLIGLF